MAESRSISTLFRALKLQLDYHFKEMGDQAFKNLPKAIEEVKKSLTTAQNTQVRPGALCATDICALVFAGSHGVINGLRQLRRSPS